jgi:hypothetical protein
MLCDKCSMNPYFGNTLRRLHLEFTRPIKKTFNIGKLKYGFSLKEFGECIYQVV